MYSLKTYNLRICDHRPNKKLHNSADVVQILKSIYATLDQDQEHFVLLSLDAKNKLIAFKVLFSGGQSEATIDPKVLFRNALLSGATAIMVAHNHPSNDPNPSSDDRSITKTIQACSKLLGIQFLDHIILSQDGSGHFSFAEEGLL